MGPVLAGWREAKGYRERPDDAARLAALTAEERAEELRLERVEALQSMHPRDLADALAVADDAEREKARPLPPPLPFPIPGAPAPHRTTTTPGPYGARPRRRCRTRARARSVTPMPAGGCGLVWGRSGPTGRPAGQPTLSQPTRPV